MKRLVRQKVLSGGPKSYKDLRRRRNGLKREGNPKEAAKVKAQMDRYVLNTGHKKRRKDNVQIGGQSVARTNELPGSSRY